MFVFIPSIMKIQYTLLFVMVGCLYSCSPKMWGVGTISTSNLSSFPRVLSEVMQRPHTVRIVEKDVDELLFFFQGGINFPEAILESEYRVKIIDRKKISKTTETDGVIIEESGDWILFHYKPEVGEPDFYTYIKLLEILDAIKKDKSVKVYSQKSDGLPRNYFILYKK
jgi:hypothetical protein